MTFAEGTNDNLVQDYTDDQEAGHGTEKENTQRGSGYWFLPEGSRSAEMLAESPGNATDSETPDSDETTFFDASEEHHGTADAPVMISSQSPENSPMATRVATPTRNSTRITATGTVNVKSAPSKVSRELRRLHIDANPALTFLGTEPESSPATTAGKPMLEPAKKLLIKGERIQRLLEDGRPLISEKEEGQQQEPHGYARGLISSSAEIRRMFKSGRPIPALEIIDSQDEADTEDIAADSRPRKRSKLSREARNLIIDANPSLGGTTWIPPERQRKLPPDTARPQYAPPPRRPRKNPHAKRWGASTESLSSDQRPQTLTNSGKKVILHESEGRAEDSIAHEVRNETEAEYSSRAMEEIAWMLTVPIYRGDPTTVIEKLKADNEERYQAAQRAQDRRSRAARRNLRRSQLEPDDAVEDTEPVDDEEELSDIEQQHDTLEGTASDVDLEEDKDEELEAMKREHAEWLATQPRPPNRQPPDEEALEWVSTLEPLPKELEKMMYAQLREERKRKVEEDELKQRMKGNLEWEQQEKRKREREIRQNQYLEAALQRNLVDERKRNAEREKSIRARFYLESETEDDEQSDGDIEMEESAETQEHTDMGPQKEQASIHESTVRHSALGESEEAAQGYQSEVEEAFAKVDDDQEGQQGDLAPSPINVAPTRLTEIRKETVTANTNCDDSSPDSESVGEEPVSHTEDQEIKEEEYTDDEEIKEEEHTDEEEINMDKYTEIIVAGGKYDSSKDKTAADVDPCAFGKEYLWKYNQAKLLRAQEQKLTCSIENCEWCDIVPDGKDTTSRKTWSWISNNAVLKKRSIVADFSTFDAECKVHVTEPKQDDG